MIDWFYLPEDIRLRPCADEITPAAAALTFTEKPRHRLDDFRHTPGAFRDHLNNAP